MVLLLLLLCRACECILRRKRHHRVDILAKSRAKSAASMFSFVMFFLTFFLRFFDNFLRLLLHFCAIARHFAPFCTRLAPRWRPWGAGTRRYSMDLKLRSPFFAHFWVPTDSQKPPKIDFLRPPGSPKSIFCNSLPIFGAVAIIRRVLTKKIIVL